MKDLINLCLAGIFAIAGFMLILIATTSPVYGGLLPFLLGVGSVIIAFCAFD